MNSPNNLCNLPTRFPPQHQTLQPGIEAVMIPRPLYEPPPSCTQKPKLKNKVALITGGDSGIGRAVACAFAKEEANVAIVYSNEHIDAKETKTRIEQLGRKCILIAIDIADERNSPIIVREVIGSFGRLDIIVNNTAVIYPKNNLEEISTSQLEWTFRVNVFSYFNLTKAALPFMKPGGSIINTSSIAAFKPYGVALDYEASKGAVIAFTNSLAKSLMSRGIRVNSVAPGETWTPMIPAAFPADMVASWGTNTPMGRAAQPFEMAQAYVFLASDDSSYMSGQTLHMYS